MNECKHCRISHTRLSCPYCGHYTESLTKVLGKTFRGNECFGPVGKERMPMVRSIASYRTDTGMHRYEVRGRV